MISRIKCDRFELLTLRKWVICHRICCGKWPIFRDKKIVNYLVLWWLSLTNTSTMGARSWQNLRHWLAVTNFIDKLTRLIRSWQGIKPRGCEVDGGEVGSQRGPRGWPYRAISSGLGLDRVRPAWLIESLVERQGWAPARRCFPKKPYTVHEPSPQLGSGWARQARGARA